jgi:hypothetical protein
MFPAPSFPFRLHWEGHHKSGSLAQLALGSDFTTMPLSFIRMSQVLLWFPPSVHRSSSTGVDLPDGISRHSRSGSGRAEPSRTQSAHTVGKLQSFMCAFFSSSMISRLDNASSTDFPRSVTFILSALVITRDYARRELRRVCILAAAPCIRLI